MSEREQSELTDAKTRASSGGIVLVTPAAGQFLMTLDRSVMNVSIATGIHVRFGRDPAFG